MEIFIGFDEKPGGKGGLLGREGTKKVLLMTEQMTESLETAGRDLRTAGTTGYNFSQYTRTTDD